MDESERPTDETKGLTEEEAWVMPEPVFRSSSGFTPGSKDLDPELEIPTEPIGFKENIESPPRSFTIRPR